MEGGCRRQRHVHDDNPVVFIGNQSGRRGLEQEEEARDRDGYDSYRHGRLFDEKADTVLVTGCRIGEEYVESRMETLDEVLLLERIVLMRL